MSSVNKVMLLGNVGRDPEIRFTQAGQKMANISLATADQWRDKQTGERKEKTEWHRVVIFDERLADVAEKYIRKGSKVYLEGALQTRKWTDNDGVEKYTTEVVLQRFKGSIVLLNKMASEGGAADYDQSPAGEERSEGNAGAGNDDLDDEIPF